MPAARTLAVSDWLGVLAAVLVSGCAAAVLARSAGQPPSRAGQIAGGLLSVLAATLVTTVLFRLRRAAGGFTIRVHRAALALIVVVAGMLASGLGGLQEAGLLAGQRWVAADLTAQVPPGSWWGSLVTGVTGLTPRLTVLQVVAWLAYVALVSSAFVRAGRVTGSSAAAASATTTAAATTAATATAAGPVAVLVIVLGVVGGLVVAALPVSDSAASTTVTVTRTECAPGWESATAGTQRFRVDNQSGMPGEINLDDSAGNIVGEIESIGPGTSAQLTATLRGGTYVFRCFMGAQPTTASSPVRVLAHGRQFAGGPVAVKPVTLVQLEGPNKRYEAYAARQLAALAAAVTRIQGDLSRGDLAVAKADWLPAQLDWERVGASYDSFGDLGLAVDGLPDGVHDKNFTGLHRLEDGLWHGQSAAALLPVAAALATNVAAVRQHLTSADLAGDPSNLPLRAHEILEDALRDHLSGIDDEGGGAAFAQTYADLQVTRAVLGYLAPLVNVRQPGLPAIVDGEFDLVRRALLATKRNGRWEPLTAVPLKARQQVDASIGAALETLAAVPDLLEIPPSR